MTAKAERDGEEILIATPSYRGDVERCAVLCQSIDEFAGPEFRHQIVVPRRDYGLFAKFDGPRRDVVTVQDVMPMATIHLPARRELWLAGYRYRLRGWVMQQLVKIAVARAGAARAVVFADSDVAFIRPFAAADFIRDGKSGSIGSPIPISPPSTVTTRNGFAARTVCSALRKRPAGEPTTSDRW